MANGLTPPAVDQSGNLLVLWVPALTAPEAGVKLTELTGAEVKDLTYSFTPSGYNPTGDQTIDKDPRLTLKTPLESLGTIARSLALQYVSNGPNDVAANVLIEGTSGYIVERRGVPIEEPLAIDDDVTYYPVSLGAQVEDPPTGTGKFTTSQKTALNGVPQKVKVVA